MAKTSKQEVEAPEVEPLRNSGDVFGARAHKVHDFNVIVDGGLTAEDLEDPKFWVNVAKNFEMGNTEIRIQAYDLSFIAHGICTYVGGTTARIKIYSFIKLDEVSHNNIIDPVDEYIVKMMGPKKWCIVNNSNGEVIKENLETQLIAMQELSDFKKALRS